MATQALADTRDEMSDEIERILVAFRAARSAANPGQEVIDLRLVGSAADAGPSEVAGTSSAPVAIGRRHIQLRRRTLVALILFLVLAGVNSLHVLRVMTPSPVPARLESDMRSVLALIVEQVEAERARTGRLPAHLPVAALAAEETIVYRRLGPQRYRVVLAAGPLRVEFDSEVGSAQLEAAPAGGRDGP